MNCPTTGGFMSHNPKQLAIIGYSASYKVISHAFKVIKKALSSSDFAVWEEKRDFLSNLELKKSSVLAKKSPENL